MGEGAPWVELLMGLGRVTPAITSIGVDIDPEGALKLSLRTAISPAVGLAAEIAMSGEEARRVGRQLAELDARAAAFMFADGADLLASQPGPLELMGAVALVRSLMTPRPEAKAHA